MENKKQIGGKRRGAGRKPVLSKKKQISLYVEGIKILKFGSEEKLKDKLYDFINGELIEYKEATPDSYDGKKIDKITYDEPKQYQEPTSTITGLPPKVSLFSEFMAELDNCKTFDEVEKVMKKAKGEAFLPRDRMSLENRAKQVVSEKGLYND